ncbi:hypothetical protein FGO68_gene3237 [Halteria grandinella]|uniref:Cadherin domain-containing protein n=1 Tax=Halteria grandinella TaxID=5974 RepID=A0A8J8P1S9_HALGN|nr:hypothetical protein FGO68_gene3237 [Halteria grandinella]
MTTKSFDIEQFTAQKLSTQIKPAFSYKLKSFNDATFKISVNETTGKISLNLISSLVTGTYTLIIEGRLQDSQSITATFLLYGEDNVAPVFDQIVGLDLPDIIAPQLTSVEYPLPNVYDPNMGQSKAVSILVALGGVPIFVDFIVPPKTALRVIPTLLTPIRNYSVYFILNDGLNYTIYTQRILVQEQLPNQIVIRNMGAPVFVTEIESVTVEIGKSITYTLPEVTDPDNDPVKVSVNLGDAMFFSKYDSGQGEFKFRPTKSTATKLMYEVSVVLTDENEKPMSSKYTLIVNVLEPIVVSIITEPQSISDTKQTFKCFLKILRVTRTGELYLKITSSNSIAAQLIASRLNESDVHVSISNRPRERIGVKIEKVTLDNVLQLKLDLENKGSVSASTVSHLSLHSIFLGAGHTFVKNSLKCRTDHTIG